MPLINSLEDDRVKRLKSLTYPGRSPYIRKDINNPGPDSSGQLRARAEDLVRLTNMFLDAPGVKFGVNQALLKSQDGLNARQIAGSVITNVTTMLKQVPVNGTGTHFSYIDNRADLTYIGNNNAATEALKNGAIGIPTKTSANRIYYDVTTERATRKTDGNGKYEDRGHIKRTQYLDKGMDTRASFIGAKLTEGGPQGDAVNLLAIGSDLGKDAQDLVPVKVRRIGTDNSLLVFRGFISNLSDNFTGNWQNSQYVGRMEPFFTYTGFGRTITFTLTIPIFSVLEQDPVYKKLNSLVSYTAPIYTGTSKLAQGSFAEMQIGDYLKSAGIITSVNLSYAVDVPWGGHTVNGAKILPQVITAQISFTPVHSAAPEYVADGTLPYIGGHNSGSKAQTIQYVKGYYEEVEDDFEVNPITGEAKPVSRMVKIPYRKSKVKGVIEVGDGYFDDIDNEFNSL